MAEDEFYRTMFTRLDSEETVSWSMVGAIDLSALVTRRRWLAGGEATGVALIATFLINQRDLTTAWTEVTDAADRLFAIVAPAGHVGDELSMAERRTIVLITGRAQVRGQHFGHGVGE